MQRRRQIVQIASEDVLLHPSLSVGEICDKIRYSRLITNNLSLSRDEQPLEKSLYSDGVFIDSERVFKLFEDGASIILRGAHKYFPSLDDLMRKIQRPWHCDCQVNLYLSRPEVNATYPHFDPHELFIFQLHGTKVWKIYESKYIFPQVGDGYDKDRHGHGGLVRNYELLEGDVLFLPRGAIHQPVAKTSSIHVSVGLMPLSRAYVLSRLIEVMAELDTEFRELALQGSSSENSSMVLKKLLARTSDFLEESSKSTLFFASLEQELPEIGEDLTRFFERQ